MKSSANLLSSLKSVFAAIVIPLEIVIAVLIYVYVLGNPENFQGGDPANHPLPGNYLGVVYKGGFIVPILLSLLIMVLTFAVERFLTISRAKGKGNIKDFVSSIKHHLNLGNLYEALSICDKQKGSVANVVRAGLVKYEEMKDNFRVDQEKKILAIRKDIEETTQLEMPMLEKNLVIISTIASIATLMGLLGTVMGMIKAFAALATAGAPDAVALANGISEALINTALGIGTSALAIIFYNYFTTKIDAITYAIDEAAYSIVQNFAATSNSEDQKITY
ncbi:MotA/TolQ/ExbB proton channel family protein [Catalinimonas sp. 4WD22]|uniref:MotA/TolQ/ExbB proton channel family protein n=1 Tax=Catalinimonas locisalis TaxID=3133978 RepID=UPI0031010EBD